MQGIISIDEFLKRQKDVFDTYVKSHGREDSLLPLIEEYRINDKVEYQSEDILRYLTSYIKSNLITESELDSYNQTRIVSNEIIFKRGKIIVKALIQSQGDERELAKYALYFSRQDGKFNPYPIRYLYKCRDYYLTHSNNQALVSCYKTIKNLAKRGEYDVELINQILSIESNQDAIKFINQINISKASLKSLIDEYKVLYPANKDDYNRLNNLYREAYKFNKKVVKFIDLKQKHETLNDRIKNLKRILEEYLISDISDISDLYVKYHFTEYKFKETIKDAQTSRDIILNSLLNKYFAKEQHVLEQMKTIIDKIFQAYENGVFYGNGYRKMNLYDYYILKGEYTNDELISYAKKIYNHNDYNKIITILSSFSDVVLTKKELLNILSKDQSLDSEILEDIIAYLEYLNIPLSKEIFYASLERYNENDIDFEIEEKEELVVNK